MHGFLYRMRSIALVGMVVLLVLAGCDSQKNTARECVERTEGLSPSFDTFDVKRGPGNATASLSRFSNISGSSTYPDTYRWRPSEQGDGASNRGSESRGYPMTQEWDTPSGYWRGGRGADADGYRWRPPQETSSLSRSMPFGDDSGYASPSQWHYPGNPGTELSLSERFDRGENRWKGYRFRPWQTRGDEVTEGNRRRNFDIRSEFPNGGWLDAPEESAGRRPWEMESWRAEREVPVTEYGESRWSRDSSQGRGTRGTRQNAVGRHRKADSPYREKRDFSIPMDSMSGSPAADRTYTTW
ncbi:hypothetical protein CCP4SC76_7430017 [Gammaproteobacteria bacterium]